MDYLVHFIADLQLNVITFADNANVGAAQLTQQIQRRLRLLTQGQAQAVLLTAVLDRLIDVRNYTIKTVRRTRTFDPLVRALMVVEPHPVIQPLTRIGERSEHRLFEELAPDRLPEPLDLAQCHRVMWS